MILYRFRPYLEYSQKFPFLVTILAQPHRTSSVFNFVSKNGISGGVRGGYTYGIGRVEYCNTGSVVE